MRKLLLFAALALAGCSSLNPMVPTPSTGWLFQVGTPAVVHVPVIADQGTAQTQTTHFGTVRNSATPAPAASPAMPVVPVPRGNVQPSAGPCQE